MSGTVTSEPDFGLTPNFTHTWSTIISSFSPKIYKIHLILFEILPKNSFFTPGWPDILRTRFFPDMRFSPKEAHYWPLLTCTKPKKTNENFSRKYRKTPFWPRFDPFSPEISTPRFFFKNPASSVFLFHQYTTPCKKSKKTNERLSVTFTYGPTNGLFIQL